MDCSKCGFTNPNRATFCLNCGARLEADAEASAPEGEVEFEEIDSDVAPLRAVQEETQAAGAPGLETDRFKLLKQLQKTPIWAVYYSLGKEDRSEGITVMIPPESPVSAYERDELVETGLRVSEFRNPGAVPVYEVAKKEMSVFTTSARPSGKSLAQTLRVGRTLPWKEAVSLIVKVLEVLDAAHADGLIHEDVRPDNIYVGKSGEVLVNLFGLSARYRELVARHEQLTQKYFRYMAPEQVTGQALGPYTDLYALGVVLHEMLTGCPPFESGDIGYRHAVATATFHTPADNPVPSELVEIVLRFLMKVPQLRYSRADEAVSDLQALLEGTPRKKRFGEEPAPAERVQGFQEAAEPPSLFITEEDEQIIAPTPSPTSQSGEQTSQAISAMDSAEFKWDSRIEMVSPAKAEDAPIAEAKKEKPKKVEVDPEAEKVFEEALDLQHAGDLDAAVKKYTEAIGKAPHFAAAYNNRGMAYYDMGRHDEAIADFTAAIDIDDEYEEAYLGRGLARFVKRAYRDAISDYTTAIKLNPDDPTAYYNRGIAYYELKDFSKAYDDYSKVIQQDDNSATAYYNRGIAAYKMRDWNQALKDFDKVLELNPKQANAYFNRGNILGKRGEVQRALDDLGEAVKLKPDYAIAFFTRGTLYNRTGETEKAIADFTESIRLNPKHSQSYYSRGCAYGNLDKFLEATKDFDEAIRLDSDYAAAYYNRAIAYEMLGYKKKANPDFEMAEKLGYKPK